LKKVLFISSSPSHPQNAGDRARIHTLAGWLEQQGFDLHFLYVSGTERDLPAMRAFWQDKLYFVFSNPVRYTLPVRAANFLKKLFWVEQLRRQLRYGGAMGADDWYTPRVARQVEGVLAGKHFDVVICAYLFYSKALERLPAATLKIIDTIDAQSIRDKRYLKGAFHTTPQQEAKALNRADLVLAIQSQEKAYFQTLTSRKVILLGHPVAITPDRPLRKVRRKLLFIGSTYESNVAAIEYFIKQVLPLVLNTYPEAELTIAGRVCEKIGNYARCTKVGQVENLTALYAATDVAINPILAGRGLKIKNIEALSFGTPLVTTTVGAEGLEEGVGKAFLVGDTAAAFAGEVCRLLANFDLYCAVSGNAYAFTKQYNQEAYAELTKELERLRE
jgi:glycosyltransferase involved in cell wall biosynthesis